jgi:diaminopimelate decarboxylase
MHIGSQLMSPQPYVEAAAKVLALIDRLRGAGFALDCLDLGGGFGADYGVAPAPLAEDYAAALVPLLRGKGLRLILEPGRQIDCNAGLLLTRVLYVKSNSERKFVIVDAAMNDLIRPRLYDAFHFIWPASSPQPPRRLADYAPPGCEKVDVVGGVCESTDFLATDRLLPPLARGALLAVFSAGAYGFVMSSQYNSRPRSAEVLVEGDDWRLIRRRESYEDLVAAENGLE